MMERLVLTFKKHYYLLTAILIFLSYPSYDFWFLKGFTFFAWFSMAPLFAFIRNKSFKELYFTTFITTLVGNYLVCNWIGSFGANVPGGSFVVLAFLIPYLTVFSSVKILIAEFMSRRFERLRILIYPSAWILIDYLQSIGHIAFPWTYLGYSQYPFTAFIQISSFFGVMGITFILIMANCLISDIIIFFRDERGLTIKKIFSISQFRRLLIFIILMVFIVVYGGFVLFHNKESVKKDIRVSIVQSCISPWENWKVNRFKYLKDLTYYTNLSLHQEPDIIFWSESATLENISFNYFKDRLNPFEKLVLAIAESSNTPLLTGEIGIYEDRSFNRYYPQNNAVLINENGEVVKTYPKIHLVPFGEWFPYEKWLPFIKKLVVKFGGSNFIPGDGPVMFEVKGKKFAVLICYEGIFYRLCREYKMSGADFFVNVTNDGWTDSYSGHMQHFSASKFRAIENGIWYLRAGNTGYTAIIDPYGRITKSIPILKHGFLVGDVDFELNHETFYSRFGDVFLYVSMCFLLALVFILVFRMFKSRSSDMVKPEL